MEDGILYRSQRSTKQLLLWWGWSAVLCAAGLLLGYAALMAHPARPADVPLALASSVLALGGLGIILFYYWQVPQITASAHGFGLQQLGREQAWRWSDLGPLPKAPDFLPFSGRPWPCWTLEVAGAPIRLWALEYDNLHAFLQLAAHAKAGRPLLAWKPAASAVQERPTQHWAGYPSMWRTGLFGGQLGFYAVMVLALLAVAGWGLASGRPFLMSVLLAVPVLASPFLRHHWLAFGPQGVAFGKELGKDGGALPLRAIRSCQLLAGYKQPLCVLLAGADYRVYPVWVEGMPTDKLEALAQEMREVGIPCQTPTAGTSGR